MKALLSGAGIAVFCLIAAARADNFFDGLIVSEEMQQEMNKEQAMESGKSQAEKILESKPVMLKVQKSRIKKEEVRQEEAVPVVREPAPFGLKWLATVDEIKYLHVRLVPRKIKDMPDSYTATHLPNGVSAFREVIVSFGGNDALWRIAAYGNFIRDNSSAAKGVAEYRKYYAMLQKKYGNAQQFFTPAVVNVDENITNADGTTSVVSSQKEIGIGDEGFLQKLVSGESSLYATFDNGKIGVTLALSADGEGRTFIVVDYKNLSAIRGESEELYNAL